MKAADIIEVDKVCCVVLSGLHRRVVTPTDARSLDMSTLVSCDGVIGTAPCQDFSRQGLGAGTRGLNGSLSLLQLEMIHELASRGDRKLKWVLLESAHGFYATTVQEVGRSMPLKHGGQTICVGGQVCGPWFWIIWTI